MMLCAQVDTYEIKLISTVDNLSKWEYFSVIMVVPCLVFSQINGTGTMKLSHGVHAVLFTYIIQYIHHFLSDIPPRPHLFTVNEERYSKTHSVHLLAKLS